MDCCDKMELIEFLPFEPLVCKNCCAVSDHEEGPVCLPSSYKIKHHISEIFAELQCAEPGRNKIDIEKIKIDLNGDYSLANIVKHCKGKHRKHLTYIYCTINKLDPPNINKNEKEIISRVIHNIQDSTMNAKLPYYRYIISAVCDQYGFDHIKKYIYIKNKNVKWDELIKQNL